MFSESFCEARATANSQPLQRLHFTASDATSKLFRTIIHAYNNSLAMVCVKADWTSRSSGSFAFHPTMTVHCWIYHYLDAMISSENLRPCFLSVHNHDTDYVDQNNIRKAQMPNHSSTLLHQLTAMLHASSHYLHYFVALWDWVTPVDAPSPCQMIIQSDSRPSGEHACLYGKPQTSEITAVIPGEENRIIGRQGNVICRRGQLNKSGSERFTTIPVTLRSYDPLTYALLPPHETDGWLLSLFLWNAEMCLLSVVELQIVVFYVLRISFVPAPGWIRHYIFKGSCLFNTTPWISTAKLIRNDFIHYFHWNQTALHAADYTLLSKQLANSETTENIVDAVQSGHLFILPHLYVRGDQYMQQNMHDIKAISSKESSLDTFFSI